MGVMTGYSKKKSPMTFAYADCWLARRVTGLRPATEETWKQLLDTQDDSSEYVKGYLEECFIGPQGSTGTIPAHDDCVIRILGHRHAAAILLGKHAAARQTAEFLATIVAATGRGRQNLMQILGMHGQMLQGSEAERSLQYLAGLGDARPGIREEEVAAAVRRQTRRVSSPWESPAEAAMPV
jgi:hypothetical protein